jgi:Domain of unknown function (DUF4365)
MTSQILGPRKQRTRQNVIADLSIHYVEGFILEEGHTTQRLGSDYGYDLIMRTFDEQGYIEPGAIYFQFKAMETLHESGVDFVFDLDTRDYKIREELPVILILFDANSRRAFWLPIQRYFEQDETRRPKKGTKTVRVRVPKQQVVNRRAIANMCHLR